MISETIKFILKKIRIKHGCDLIEIVCARVCVCVCV